MELEKRLQIFLLEANDLLAMYAIEVDGGNADALPLMVVCNQLKKACEQYAKQYQAKAHAEASQYGKDGVMVMGYRVRPAELGTTYDFVYPDWVQKALLQTTETTKQYEEMAKKATTPYIMLDPATGEELWQVVPAVKKSSSGVKISEK